MLLLFLTLEITAFSTYNFTFYYVVSLISSIFVPIKFLLQVRKIILLALLLPIFFQSCRVERNEILSESSPYCEDSAMAHFLTSPRRSIELLDSAVIVHSLTAERAQLLQAIVFYNGMNRPDSCLALCQSLLDRQGWLAFDSEDEQRSFQLDIYRLMASASTSTGNLLATMRYTSEGAKLAHGIDNLIGAEADMLSRSGYVMCQTGQTDEGIDAMTRAGQLAESDNTWSSRVSYLNNAKKLSLVYLDLKRYAECRVTVEKTLIELDKTCESPQKFLKIPETMLNDSISLQEFKNFYCTQFYAYMAYVCGEEGKLDEAQQWLNRFEAIGRPDRYSMVPCVIHTLVTLGHFDEARRQIEALKQSGTLGPDLVPILREEQLVNKHIGNLDTALQLAEKIDVLKDSLNQYNYQLLLADASTQYQLQEERQRRKDSEDRQKFLILAVILSLCVIVVLAGALFIRKLMAHRRRLNTELAEAKTEIETLRESQEKAKALSTEEMYKRVCFVVEHYQHFREPDFDINVLSQLVFSNRTYVSAAINQISGMNFRAWLGRYRIAYAKQIMASDQDLSIDQIAAQCGYENRPNFNRQFKAITGLTPSEWMNQQRSSGEEEK